MGSAEIECRLMGLLNRDALRQITWLVDVGPLHVSDVVGEQLQRHRRNERLQELLNVGNIQNVFRDAGQLFVSFGCDPDDQTLTGHHFLEIAAGLVVMSPFRTDHNDGHILIDKRDGPMLHLTSRIALGVDVADLLQFESALKGDGIVLSSPEI